MIYTACHTPGGRSLDLGRPIAQSINPAHVQTCIRYARESGAEMAFYDGEDAYTHTVKASSARSERIRDAADMLNDACDAIAAELPGRHVGLYGPYPINIDLGTGSNVLYGGEREFKLALRENELIARTAAPYRQADVMIVPDHIGADIDAKHAAAFVRKQHMLAEVYNERIAHLIPLGVMNELTLLPVDTVRAMIAAAEECDADVLLFHGAAGEDVREAVEAVTR